WGRAPARGAPRRREQGAADRRVRARGRRSVAAERSAGPSRDGVSGRIVSRVEATLPATAPPVLHLSLIVGSELVDRSGGKLGKVDDAIVRLGDDEYPPVTG